MKRDKTNLSFPKPNSLKHSPNEWNKQHRATHATLQKYHQVDGDKPAPTAPSFEDLVNLKITPAYRSIQTNNHTRMPVLFELNVCEESPLERSPVTLSLCLDNSGSMAGDPLSLVLQSVKLIAAHLQPQDRIGLVSFADQARMWLPPECYEGTTPARLEQCLSEIHTEGYTAMYDGLAMSLESVPAKRPAEASRLLLLSDGIPNLGPDTTEELAAIVKQKRGDTVVSTFGFGAQHDEQMLQSIAKAGGGGYTFIENAQTAPNAFALELGALFSTIARHTTLTLRPGDACTLLKIHSEHETRYSSKGVEIALSDLIAGQKVSLLVDVDLDATKMDELPWLTCELKFFPPQLSETISFQKELVVQTSMKPGTTMHPAVCAHLLVKEAAGFWEAAQQLAQQGRYQEASASLTMILKRLRDHEDWATESSEIRDWYEQLVDEKEIYDNQPSREWYQEYRKVAIAEMSVPGSAAYTSGASPLGANQAQQQMVEQFRIDGGKRAQIEIISQRSGVKETVEIDKEVSIGRVQGNQIVLPGGNISKRHAKIVPSRQGFLLVDLHSTNGAYINGKKLHNPELLKEGDQIYIGDFTLRFHELSTP